MCWSADRATAPEAVDLHIVSTSRFERTVLIGVSLICNVWSPSHTISEMRVLVWIGSIDASNGEIREKAAACENASLIAQEYR